jgi:hypothetical protein
MEWTEIKKNAWRVMDGEAVLIAPDDLKRFTSYFRPGKLEINMLHGSYIVQLKEVQEYAFAKRHSTANN